MDNEEIQGVKFSEFPSATPGDSDEVVGLHSGDNARFSVANFVLAIRQGLANIFVPKSDVGAANGVAELDNTGKVPSSQLPPIPSDASDIEYDPTLSGLTATDVQAAIDEVVDDLDDKQASITANGILKGDGAGGVSAATAGTDYATPTQPEGKANQAQLAYVETGTTASQNYTAGQYICWNGLLYTADTAIASGATFYTSGGNKNLTECVGGGLNNVIRSLEIPYASFTYNSQYRFWYIDNANTAIPGFPSAIKGIVANCTNGRAFMGARYSSNSLSVYGISQAGGQLDGTYEFTTTILY